MPYENTFKSLNDEFVPFGPLCGCHIFIVAYGLLWSTQRYKSATEQLFKAGPVGPELKGGFDHVGWDKWRHKFKRFGGQGSPNRHVGGKIEIYPTCETYEDLPPVCTPTEQLSNSWDQVEYDDDQI